MLYCFESNTTKTHPKYRSERRNKQRVQRTLSLFLSFVLSLTPSPLLSLPLLILVFTELLNVQVSSVEFLSASLRIFFELFFSPKISLNISNPRSLFRSFVCSFVRSSVYPHKLRVSGRPCKWSLFVFHPSTWTSKHFSHF